MNELTPKERAREYIGKLFNQYADWENENRFNMKYADNNLFDQMFTENRMLDIFRQELTHLQNIVNDIEEAV